MESRLEKIDLDKDLLPWRRAHRLSRCFLYWIPVTSFPAPEEQRQWLLQFFDRFSDALAKQAGLRPEIFLQFKTAMDRLESFQKLSPKFSPLIGLSRKPGDGLPQFPTKKDMEPVMRGEKDFDLKQWIADYCYWFVNKQPKQQRHEFLGSGGTTMIYLKPDPKTAVPPLPLTEAFRKKHPVFQAMDVDAIVQGACSLRDSFLAKSKELFGVGLEAHPQFPGIQFILPLLGTGHFLSLSDEENEKWFQLFDVYVNESPADKGMLLAFKVDYQDMLIDVLEDMRKAELVYQ